MFEWIAGKPPVLLRDVHVDRWPGHGPAERRMRHFAGIGEFAGEPLLMLRDPELTTVVPLELGGLMLVTAEYCENDDELSAHLDLLPVSGWEILPQRFRSDGGTYVLFDGSLSGAELRDPAEQKRILEKHGGAIKVAIEPGAYEIECMGPWAPDERTSLYLTRLVKVG